MSDVAGRGESTGLTTLLLSPIRLSFVDRVTGGERQRGGNYLSLLGDCGSHKSSLSILILVTWDTWSLAGPAGVLEPSLAARRAAQTPGYVSKIGFGFGGSKFCLNLGWLPGVWLAGGSSDTSRSRCEDRPGGDLGGWLRCTRVYYFLYESRYWFICKCFQQSS
jgi:hypothetical protein